MPGTEDADDKEGRKDAACSPGDEVVRGARDDGACGSAHYLHALLGRLPYTKIICTVGPSSQDGSVISRMVSAGMSVVRLNMSHGNREEHLETISRIRLVCRVFPGYVAIAIDTRGAEVRTVLRDAVAVKEGQEVELLGREKSRLDSCQHDNLSDCASVIGTTAVRLPLLKPGAIVAVDDSKLRLVVKETSDCRLAATALNDHLVETNKKVTFSEMTEELPFLQDEDVEDIKFAVEHGLDAVFLSFTESAEQVESVRQYVGPGSVQLIAKIESRLGIENIDEIVRASDGVMIARGDLLSNLSAERLFSAQKLLAEKGHTKPLIMATDLLRGMIDSPYPSGAEISDIGNAIMDGCSALLLTNETAAGNFPVEAVEIARRVCLDAEEYMRKNKRGVNWEELLPERETREFSASDRSARQYLFRRAFLIHNNSNSP